MKCVICKHGDTRPGLTTSTLTNDALTLVVRNVPAHVCEAYVDEDIASRVLIAADDAAQAGDQVAVREYVII